MAAAAGAVLGKISKRGQVANVIIDGDEESGRVWAWRENCGWNFPGRATT
jgi:hypothetical protein